MTVYMYSMYVKRSNYKNKQFGDTVMLITLTSFLKNAVDL